MCRSFLWPTTPGWQADYWFLSQKSQVVLEYASWVCLKSLWPVSLCWASKIGFTCTNEGTKHVAKMGKIGTFQCPYIPGLESKCKNFITRWLGNKPGQSWTTSAANILILALYGVVGQWKVTKWGAFGVLVNWWKKGSRKMAYLSQKTAKNAQSWLKLKLESSCMQYKHP